MKRKRFSTPILIAAAVLIGFFMYLLYQAEYSPAVQGAVDWIRPAVTVVCTDKDYEITVTLSGGEPNYKFQVATDAGFTNLINFNGNDYYSGKLGVNVVHVPHDAGTSFWVRWYSDHNSWTGPVTAECSTPTPTPTTPATLTPTATATATPETPTATPVVYGFTPLCVLEEAGNTVAGFRITNPTDATKLFSLSRYPGEFEFVDAPATPGVSDWAVPWVAGQVWTLAIDGQTYSSAVSDEFCVLPPTPTPVETPIPTATPDYGQFAFDIACTDSPSKLRLRITNNTAIPQAFSLVDMNPPNDTFDDIAGPGESLWEVQWTGPASWRLIIGGLTYVAATDTNPLCVPPPPPPTPTPTPTGDVDSTDLPQVPEPVVVPQDLPQGNILLFLPALDD